jgi:S-adenosylmethionine/arginine decarboxylase-like enzyme
MAVPVHHHLIVRAEVKKPLSDVELTKTWLDELVTKIGMKKVSGPHAAYVEKEGNKGVTGCVIIETSHIALHVWDETNPALVQLDVYTCSCLPLEAVFEHLDVMQPRKIEYKFLDREHGLKFVK